MWPPEIGEIGASGLMAESQSGASCNFYMNTTSIQFVGNF